MPKLVIDRQQTHKSITSLELKLIKVTRRGYQQHVKLT